MFSIILVIPVSSLSHMLSHWGLVGPLLFVLYVKGSSNQKGTSKLRLPVVELLHNVTSSLNTVLNNFTN